MKKIYVLLLFALIPALSHAQIKSVGFVLGAGYTAINIEEVVGVSTLEEWDNIAVMIKASVEFEVSDKFILVGEAGSNRLYYWEYRWSDGFYSGSRYRAEWTTNLGVHLKRYFGGKWFLQAGPGLHIFNDGTGVVPGLALSSGVILNVTEKFSIPLGFRAETVFGSGTPSSLMLGTGFNFQWVR